MIEVATSYLLLNHCVGLDMNYLVNPFFGDHVDPEAIFLLLVVDGGAAVGTSTTTQNDYDCCVVVGNVNEKANMVKETGYCVLLGGKKGQILLCVECCTGLF